MTQATQEKNLIRNTSYIRIRSRNWCFTINNYMESEIEKLEKGGIGYQYLFQEEKGKEETKHLQGILCFKNAVGLRQLKELNKRAHWEPARNKIASIQYCCKDETRDGKIFSNFDYRMYIKNLYQPKKVEKEKTLEEIIEDTRKETIEEFNRQAFEKYWKKINMDVS